MRLSISRGKVLSLVVFIGLSDAIIFDASCARYDTLLRKGFTTAFTNADQAQAALITTPPRSGVNNVARWLFGRSSNFAIARTRLKNVGNIPSSFTYDKTDKSNLANIVAYCNVNRLVPTPRGLYDGENGVYNRMTDAQFQGCKTGVSPDGKDPPMAMTINDARPGTLTTMDLCTWYLDYYLGEKYQTVEDVDTPGVLQRIEGDPDYYLTDSEDEETGMDAATLFDTTILHEMTHSKVIGIQQQDSGVPEQYEWIPCTNLRSPLNSESLALFALAVYLMRNGYTVQKDGQLLTAEQLYRRSSLLQDGKKALHDGFEGDRVNGSVWVA